MKKIKNLLLVLCLIPCLLFAACSGGNAGITMKEYEDLMTKSALSYYQNNYGKSMTITTKTEYDYKYTDTVYYGEDDENEIEVEFSDKGTTTQTIEVYSNSANKAPNVKITTKTEYTETGYEENEFETGVVSYSEKEQDEQIITFVCSYDNVEEEDKVTVYIYDKVLEDDEFVETRRFYEYYDAESGYDDIWEVLESVEGNVMESAFFGSDYRTIKLACNAEPVYYNEDGAFGYDISFENNNVYNQSVTTTNTTAKMTFANNLPSKFEGAYESITVDKDTTASSSKDSGKGKVTCEIKYNSSSIQAPAGFEPEDEMYYFYLWSYVDIFFPSLDIGGGK